jgi:diacylglycerol O-acyltransferase / wax synthase
VQQLSGMDASFLYFETPRTPGHILSVYVYDPSTAPGGAVTFKGILEHYRDRLHVTRTFRQRLVDVPFGLDHPYWIEDGDFDLEFHVRHVALPAPGDWRQLCIQIARLHSRPLDMSRPLWEATVVEGLDNVKGVAPGSFAVVQKIHHAAVDGVTLLEITSAVHDTSPDADPPPSDDGWRGEPAPSPLTLLSRAAVNNATRPGHFARVMGRTFPAARAVQERVRRGELEAPEGSAPRTRFNAKVSGHRVVDARRYDLAEIKRIKSAVPGATVNDAVLTVVGGALRHYLMDNGELPDESLRVMVPISVRSDEQAGAAGNQVASMVASLGTDIADPARRLEAVRTSTHRSKAFSEASGARSMAEFAEFMPGGLAALAARTASRFEMATRGAPAVNCVVSNVPGPQVPLYFAGARLEFFFGGAAVVDGMALLHGVTSYCGEVVVSVVSDRDIMPDPATYAECLDQSFADLSAAVR